MATTSWMMNSEDHDTDADFCKIWTRDQRCCVDGFMGWIFGFRDGMATVRRQNWEGGWLLEYRICHGVTAFPVRQCPRTTTLGDGGSKTWMLQMGRLCFGDTVYELCASQVGQRTFRSLLHLLFIFPSIDSLWWAKLVFSSPTPSLCRNSRPFCPCGDYISIYCPVAVWILSPFQASLGIVPLSNYSSGSSNSSSFSSRGSCASWYCMQSSM